MRGMRMASFMASFASFTRRAASMTVIMVAAQLLNLRVEFIHLEATCFERHFQSAKTIMKNCRR